MTKPHTYDLIELTDIHYQPAYISPSSVRSIKTLPSTGFTEIVTDAHVIFVQESPRSIAAMIRDRLTAPDPVRDGDDVEADQT